MTYENIPNLFKETGFKKETLGAYPEGTNIIKIYGEKGDHHNIGSKGIVLASVAVPEELRNSVKDVNEKEVKIMYIVEMFSSENDLTGTLTFIADIKITEVIETP